MTPAYHGARPAVCVGLVDTGLDPGVDDAVAGSLVGSRAFSWDEEQGGLVIGEACADHLGHGSELAQTIVATTPGLQLLMAQVFQEEWRTRPAQVAAAIEWLMAAGARVINLSLGLRADREILRAACEHALAGGTILVASAPTLGEAVFPAQYAGVIRATADARCAPAQFSWLGGAQADVGGCARSVGGAVAGASAGAAHVTAHIAHFLVDHPAADRAQVLDHLRRRAAHTGPQRRD